MADLFGLNDQQVEPRPVTEVKHNLRLLTIGYGFLFLAFLALNLQTYVLASRIKVIREDIVNKWEFFRERDSHLTVELKHLDNDVLINREFHKQTARVLETMNSKLKIVPEHALPAVKNGASK